MTIHLLRGEGLDLRHDHAPHGHVRDDASPAPFRAVLVGTYPPTRCGIATYTASLRDCLQSLPEDGLMVDVVRVIQEGDAG